MPFSLNPARVFYGWWIIAAIFIYSLYTAGVIVYGFTSFYDPIIKEFGWTYAMVSVAASLRGAETGLMAPILGFLIDRWGSKWVLFAGAVITGLGMIFLSYINNYAGFVIGFIIVCLGVSCSGPSVITPVVNNWFRRRLGLAVGVMATGFAFSGLLIPVVTQMIDAIDWRQTLFILGIVGIVLCAPLALLVRHKPEKYGYGPDGVPLQAISQKSPSPSARVNMEVPEMEVTTGQALRTRTFWHIVIAYTLQFTIIGAMLAHVVPFLGSVGISRSTASFFAAAIPIISIIGRLGSGWLSDKFSRKKVAVVAFAIICVGTFLFDYVDNTLIWLLVIAVVLYSISYGSANTLRAVLMREYFGRKHYGTIFGILIGIMSVGTIVGPYVAGWIYDTWQSYHYAWWIFTILNVAALILLITTPRIRVKTKVEEETVNEVTSP